MSDRPYPDGIAWDEALRQRRDKEDLEQRLAVTLKALDDIAWDFSLNDDARIEIARAALKALRTTNEL